MQKNSTHYHAYLRATEAYLTYVHYGKRIYNLVSGWTTWSIQIEKEWIDFQIIGGKVKIVNC